MLLGKAAVIGTKLYPCFAWQWLDVGEQLCLTLFKWQSRLEGAAKDLSLYIFKGWSIMKVGAITVLPSQPDFLLKKNLELPTKLPA